MKNTKKIDILIKPSIFSISVTSLILIYVFITSVWLSLKNFPIFQEVNRSILDQSDIIESSNNLSIIFSSNFLNNSFINEVFYILSWAFVGILVYFCYLIIAKGFNEFLEILSIRKLVSKNKSGLKNEFIARVLFRILISILLVVYGYYYFQFFIPISAACMKAGSSFNDLEDIRYILIGVMLVVLCTHLLTILLRLVFMRIRVFGGIDEVILND